MTNINIDNFNIMYPEFDINFYKLFYSDLCNLNDDQLKYHYHIFGKIEKRICNNFNINFYKFFNPDLCNLNSDQLIKHYQTLGKYEARLMCEEVYNRFYPNFNIEYYQSFNKEMSNFSKYELYRHYHFIGNIANTNYINYDFIIDNYYTIPKNIELFHNRIYNHQYYRTINNYNDLLKYNKQFKKNFFIYNNQSFYQYYKDFDYNFYKNKYFNNIEKSEFEILLHYHLIGKEEKYLINNKNKVIIYTPSFNIHCGGILIMHYLAKIINDLNHHKFYAKLFIYNNLKYDNIFCNDFASIDEINDNTIVIYPETISGNPLNCKKVVRWILLELGIEMPFDHFRNWNINDLFYHWESTIEYNPIYKQLCCPWINPIFKNLNLERNSTCYLIKKGRLIHKNITYIHPNDSICIDEKNLIEIVNIFNQSTFFYCYDPNTAYVTFALLCKCIPIIYPIENINKETYFKNRMFNRNNIIHNSGIAYGNDIYEIDRAIHSIGKAENEISELYNSYKDTVNDFLNDLETINKNNFLPNIVRNYM